MGYWNTTRGAVIRINFESGGAFGNSIDTYFVIYKKVKQLYDILETYTSESKNMLIAERGSIKTSFNFDDLSLTPTQMNFTVYDGNAYLKSLVFDSTLYEKDFYVYQLLNEEIIFAGKVIPSTLIYDESKKQITFNAISPLDRLNNTYLFTDPEDTQYDFARPINPLINVQPDRYELNPYLESNDPTITYVTDYVLLADLIKDIYKYAGIDDVTITQDWLFRLPTTTTGGYSIGMIYVKPSYFFIEDNFQTLGDVLRYLAKCFGCYTGAKDFDSAFFKKLMYGTAYAAPFDSDPTYSYLETYELDKIDFVKVTNIAGDKYYQPDLDSASYKVYRSMEFEFPKLYALTGLGFLELTKIKDSNVGSEYLSNTELVAKFWYLIRGDYDTCKVTHFRFPNLDYRFTNLIPHNNESYQIIDLDINLTNNESTIKAVKAL